MAETPSIKDIVFEINAVAVALEKTPDQLKKDEFLEHCVETITDRVLRKRGGYAQIVKTYIPKRPLKDIQKDKIHVAYVRKLEKVAGSRESFQEQLVTSVSEAMSKLQVNTVAMTNKQSQDFINSLAINTDKEPRSLCTVWSDQHFGTTVDAEETGGKNEFNWVVGARRLGMLCQQLATYKIEKRKLHTELVILLLGDNIGGLIHNQEGPDYDLYVHQLNGALYYYVQALNYLKQFFPKIRVICQPGNHGRVMHKASKERALSQKYDSLENTIFFSLSQIFVSDSVVDVFANKAPFSDVEVQGHRLYATHGDTVFTTGNIGNTIPLHKLEQQINRVNAQELNEGKKPYEMFCTGHVHHPLFTQVTSGVKVAINGCLIGTDSYAHGIGIHSSHPVQILWETTKKFVQGDSRFIYVKEADQNTKYDKIILPYQYNLISPKTI